MGAALTLPAPAFTAALSARPAQIEPAFKRKLRQAGAARAAEGLPGTGEEAWRMTNLRALAELDLAVAGGAARLVDGADMPPIPAGTQRYVFVNGHFRDDLSAPIVDTDTAYIAPLIVATRDRAALVERALGQLAATETDGVSALNAAFHQDGLFVWIAKGTAYDAPIAITQIGGGAVSAHPRHAIVLEDHAALTLIDQASGVGEAPYLANPVTEAVIGAGARLTRRAIQAESAQARSLSQFWARLERDALFETFSLQVGGALARDDLRVRLDGPGAHTALHGIFLGAGDQHFDTMSVIGHDREHTTSDEVYRGVLDDRAIGVFQGRIEVKRDAQQIEGNQMSRGLLLSDRARALFKPELEIFADDVKCSHGSTIGQLDADALFYLRARGVPLVAARRLLIDAFVTEGLDGVEDGPIRAWLNDAAAAWLDR